MNRLKYKHEIPNYEEKSKALRENGWETWYNDDNWIKTEWRELAKKIAMADGTAFEDTMGRSTEDVYKNLINQNKDGKIIFTTKDGYNITKGMKYYSVKVKEYETHPAIKKKRGQHFNEPPLWSMAGPYINPKAHEPTGDIEYFYKKENAVEFINQNKDE